jgi:hypothetical protein
MFSKNAIEKLRGLFNTLFRTQKDLNLELLSRLPGELKGQVLPYLEGRGEQAQEQPEAKIPPVQEPPEAEMPKTQEPPEQPDNT